jgi:molecular chaperone DnaK/molecular chaperone HscA
MMDSAVTGAIGGKTMQSAGESLGEGPTAPHPFAKADIEALPKDDDDDEDPITVR